MASFVLVAVHPADGQIVLVQQDVIHPPGVHADGKGDFSRFPRLFQTRQDLAEQPVGVPYQMPAGGVRPRFRTVGKAVNFLRDQPAPFEMTQNVPPRRRPDVDRQIIIFHASPSFPPVRVRFIIPHFFLLVYMCPED